MKSHQAAPTTLASKEDKEDVAALRRRTQYLNQIILEKNQLLATKDQAIRRLEAYLTTQAERKLPAKQHLEKEKQDSEKIAAQGLQLTLLHESTSRHELEVVRLRLLLQKMAHKARTTIRDLKKQLAEVKQEYLQTKQAFDYELSKILKMETALAQQRKELLQKLNLKKKQLKILKAAVRKNLREKTQQQEELTSLRLTLTKERENLEKLIKEFAAQKLHLQTASHKAGTLQQQKVGDQAKHQASKKWLLIGVGSSTLSLSGWLLSAFVFASSFWNPAGWALFTLTALFAAYCFYEAGGNKVLSAKHTQTSGSTTSHIGLALGVREDFRPAPSLQPEPESPVPLLVDTACVYPGQAPVQTQNKQKPSVF